MQFIYCVMGGKCLFYAEWLPCNSRARCLKILRQRRSCRMAGFTGKLCSEESGSWALLCVPAARWLAELPEVDSKPGGVSLPCRVLGCWGEGCAYPKAGAGPDRGLSLTPYFAFSEFVTLTCLSKVTMEMRQNLERKLRPWAWPHCGQGAPGETKPNPRPALK